MAHKRWYSGCGYYSNVLEIALLARNDGGLLCQKDRVAPQQHPEPIPVQLVLGSRL